MSSAGARGLMQVMPFWVKLIGGGHKHNLFDMRTKLVATAKELDEGSASLMRIA